MKTHIKKTPLTGSTIKSELDEEPVAARIPLDWDEAKDLQVYRELYEGGDDTKPSSCVNSILQNEICWL